MSHTNFSAVVNGFQFINRFTAPFPVKYNLPILGEVDLSKVVFGLCGGMCFASLDYYYAGQLVPPYTKVEDIDLRLYTYLCERQLDSLSIPVVMKVIDWMLREDRELASRMARSELPKLRKSLDQGKPAVLALIRVGGGGDPTQNHQVLAIGYDLDVASEILSIQIYDPNHPHTETYLKLNVSDPKSGLKISQATGEPLRGFFIIPHKPQKKLPQLFPDRPRVEFGRDSLALPLRLRWPVDSGRVNQYFGENPGTYKPFGLPGHEGLDLFALSGANVYAAAEGEVYEADYPKGHPYGRQIRIKHEIQNRSYSTVYAHLSEVFVQAGQRVAAGETIGLADNTGNSFGSHLHLTLKIEDERTPGYPDGIVDPWPYLQETVVPSPAAVETFQGWTVFTISEASLMAGTEPAAQVAAVLPSGEFLGVVGDVEAARPKVGLQGEWLQVISAGGQSGYIGAWLVQNAEGAFPPSDLVIYPNDMVNLRSGPGTVFNLLGTLKAGQPLTVLGDADRARSRLGREKEWLQIQAEDGLRGFVAAWLVHQTGQYPSPSGLVVFPAQVLNVRARPSTEANILTVVSPGDALTVLGERDQVEGSIGQADRWLNVRAPGKFVGYVAAWMVSTSSSAPSSSQSASGLTVYPTAEINLRAQSSLNSPRVGGAYRNEPLLVIDPDQAAAREKIGKPDLWIYTQAKNGQRGWAASWLLSEAKV